MNFNKLIIINTSFIQNQTGIRVIRRLYFDIRPITEPSWLFLTFCRGCLTECFSHYLVLTPLKALLGHQVQSWFGFFLFYKKKGMQPLVEIILDIIGFCFWDYHKNHMNWNFFMYGEFGIKIYGKYSKTTQ